MGLADFFLAHDEELAAAFPGWKRAPPLLDEFVERTVTNPFTGASTTIRTLVGAGQPEPDPDAAADGEFRHLPWIDQKGLSTVDVVSLAAGLMEWDPDRADSEVHGRLLVGSPDAEVLLCELAPALVSRLGQLGSEECKEYGTIWSVHCREDARTIPDASTRQREMARPDSEWVLRLLEISRLAKQACAGGRSMFLWISA